MRRDKSASRQKWRAIIADGRRPPHSEIVFGIVGIIGIDVEDVVDGVYVFETGTPTQPQRDRGAGAGN